METRKKIISSISISIFIFIFLIFLIINPFKKKTLSLEQKIINDEEELYTQQINTQNILKNQQKIKELDTNKIDYIFLQSENVLFFIDTLEELAKNNNCLLSLQISEPKGSNDFQEASVTLDVTGNINDVLNYLNAIEKENFYINYQTINITKAETLKTNIDSNENDVTIKINATTYWQ